MDAATLFPGPLAEFYAAFTEAVDQAGGATEQFTRTQVSMGVKRKFAWLIPLTSRSALVNLDMYEPHPDDRWRSILPLGEAKFTHQLQTDDPEAIRIAADAGYFRVARAWGAKEPTSG